MALIECSECGKTVSSKAVACPNCGNPIETINGKDSSGNTPSEGHESKSLRGKAFEIDESKLTSLKEQGAYAPWYKKRWGIAFITIIVVVIYNGVASTHKVEQDVVHDKNTPYKSQPDKDGLEYHKRRKIVAPEPEPASVSSGSSVIVNCKYAVMPYLNYPNNADFHTILGSRVDGNTVYLNFEAKNAFGMEKSHTAVCQFLPSGEIISVEIK